MNHISYKVYLYNNYTHLIDEDIMENKWLTLRLFDLKRPKFWTILSHCYPFDWYKILNDKCTFKNKLFEFSLYINILSGIFYPTKLIILPFKKNIYLKRRFGYVLSVYY